MLTIIQKKFGTKRLIVDNIVAEIEKQKPIGGEKADKFFVDFVEKLEQIQRDLKSEGLLSEVANSTMIGKIEAKLPPVIIKDWSNINIDEELDDKTSTEKINAVPSKAEKSR